MVPESSDAGTPCFSPTAMYIARRTAAGALIVIDVETFPRGISLKRVSMSARLSMATPNLQTYNMKMGW